MNEPLRPTVPARDNAQRGGRALRRAGALLAVGAMSLGTAACGNDVPPNATAKIGDEAIEKSEFDHWLVAAAQGQQPAGAAPQAVVAPDPPKFEKCAAARARQPVPKGTPKPAAAQLRDQCRQEYDMLKGQVMQFLINAEWIQREAEERDIEVADAEVEKQFGDQKKQSFPDDRQYQQFLKTSGQTEADLKFRVKLDVVSNEIRKKIVGGRGNVTDAEIQRYYAANKGKPPISEPERRDLRVVLTKDKAKATKARKAIDGGASFASIARRYSIDEASKGQGGKLAGVVKGQQEQSLDNTVFGAKPGKLLGPVRTQFGYYVLEVEKITPAVQQPLPKVKEQIRAQLRSEREQKALDDFVKRFREKYREDTNCAPGYLVSDCKNGPKEPPAPAGGVPGQGSPQGAGAPQGTVPQQGSPQGGTVPQQGSPSPSP
jgi:foldase protein PrsA